MHPDPAGIFNGADAELLRDALRLQDNFAHMGGFLFGLLAGIIFLPYVSVGGKWGARCAFPTAQDRSR